MTQNTHDLYKVQYRYMDRHFKVATGMQLLTSPEERVFKGVSFMKKITHRVKLQ